MNNMSWLVMELMAQQALREHELRSQHVAAGWHEPRDGRGVRHALASTLVRLGLRLDPAAGEGLGAYELSLAHPQPR